MIALLVLLGATACAGGGFAIALWVIDRVETRIERQVAEEQRQGHEPARHLSSSRR